MRMTNRGNRLIYRLWAPVYDRLLGGLFGPGRRRASECAAVQSGERVLLVGVGTGSDLPLLPAGVRVVGVDICAEMLEKARQRLPLEGREVILILGDAQRLHVDEESCDVVMFNLILSVIPDPAACLRENLRALKSGGRAVVFDKFAPDGGKVSAGKKLLNLGSTMFGTDITRRFGEIAQGADIEVVLDEPSLFNGMYRVKVLGKRGQR